MRNLFSNPIYVDDILLVNSDVNLLHEKKLLSSRFNKKVLGEISLVTRIEIYRDKRKGVLRLYADKSAPVPMVKGNSFENFSVPKVM
jgi:hypothetical protein